MATGETRSDRGITKQSPTAGDFAEFGAKRVETFMDVQKQLVETFEQINCEHLARIKQETELASDFAGKVTKARSIPEIMTAYQEWLSQRMALFTEYSRKLFEDSQKVVNTTMRFLSNGK
ncbi:MAG TPA: phasin family protein [Xanthobacteraceae bacterium]